MLVEGWAARGHVYNSCGLLDGCEEAPDNNKVLVKPLEIMDRQVVPYGRWEDVEEHREGVPFRLFGLGVGFYGEGPNFPQHVV